MAYSWSNHRHPASPLKRRTCPSLRSGWLPFQPQIWLEPWLYPCHRRTTVTEALGRLELWTGTHKGHSSEIIAGSESRWVPQLQPVPIFTRVQRHSTCLNLRADTCQLHPKTVKWTSVTLQMNYTKLARKLHLRHIQMFQRLNAQTQSELSYY